MSFPCWLFFHAFLFFEVLVIFAVFPVTSPSESFCLEEPVAEIAFLNHVSVVLAAVQIGAGGGRFHHFLAVLQPFVVRIVEGVDTVWVCEMKRKLKLEELLALIALSSSASQ